VQPNYIANDGASSFTTTDADSWTGKITGFESQVNPDSDYKQPAELWAQFKLNPPMADHFVSNVALNLSMATEKVRKQTYSKFGDVAEVIRC